MSQSITPTGRMLVKGMIPNWPRDNQQNLCVRNWCNVPKLKMAGPAGNKAGRASGSDEVAVLN